MRGLAVIAAAVMIVAIAGCGSTNRQGGTLTVLDLTPGEPTPDPAQTDFGYVESAIFRPLYLNVQINVGSTGLRSPGAQRRDGSEPPDLATGAPEISRDGRTITVRIRSGVRFSPPVNREVTSADVRYGIERSFLPSVASPWADADFGALAGVAAFRAGRAHHIAGIQTPDRHTIVLRLTRPVARHVARALVLPLTAPVPREYAAKYDRHTPSTYAAHVVATGPYMVARDRSGKRYSTPTVSLRLVRNPNWDPHTDFRPANVDAIDFRGGFSDPRVLVAKVLSGRDLVTGAIPPSPAVLRESLSGHRRRQFAIIPITSNGSLAMLGMNTTIPPLDNVWVRRAIAAAVDRRQISLLVGPAISPVASHYMLPKFVHDAAAAGSPDPTVPALARPGGNLALARSYLRRAGYPTGRYSGDAKLEFVAIGLTLRPLAEYLAGPFRALGLHVHIAILDPATAYEKCGRPKERIAFCYAFADGNLNDPETAFDPAFTGHGITSANNANFSELADTTVDAAIARADLVTDPAARARAFARVDQRLLSLMPAVPLVEQNVPYWSSADVENLVAGYSGLSDVTFMRLR